MQVVCFAGYSGSGKTSLIEPVITYLVAQQLRVSVIKHTHHHFDVDTPGKDTWRHRQAGAQEVLAASDRRVVLMREWPDAREPDVQQLIAQLDPGVDWVLVEGFRDSDLPKLEVLASTPEHAQRPPRYPYDTCVQAVVHSPDRALQPTTTLPCLNRDDPAAVARWLLQHATRFTYAFLP